MNKEVKGYIFDFEDIGTWWDRIGEEIDIVAYNKKERKILLGEVKWTNEQMDILHVDALLKKAKKMNFAGDYKFLFICKTGFTHRCIERMK